MLFRFLFCVWVALSVVLFAGCERESPEEFANRKELEEARLELMQAAFGFDQYARMRELLAVKYEIPLVQVDVILDKFTGKNSRRIFVTSMDAVTAEEVKRLTEQIHMQSVSAEIEELAIAAGVESAKIAAMIVDYEIWEAAYHATSF